MAFPLPTLLFQCLLTQSLDSHAAHSSIVQSHLVICCCTVPVLPLSIPCSMIQHYPFLVLQISRRYPLILSYVEFFLCFCPLQCTVQHSWPMLPVKISFVFPQFLESVVHAFSGFDRAEVEPAELVFWAYSIMAWRRVKMEFIAGLISLCDNHDQVSFQRLIACHWLISKRWLYIVKETTSEGKLQWMMEDRVVEKWHTIRSSYSVSCLEVSIRCLNCRWNWMVNAVAFYQTVVCHQFITCKSIS